MDSGRKRSLFYHRMKHSRQASDFRETVDFLDKLGNDNCALPEDTSNSQHIRSEDKHTFGERSYIIKGEDAESIHQENVALLSTMSESEIEDTRQNLLAMISPANLNFLKGSRTRQMAGSNNEENVPEPVSKETSCIEESIPPVVKELYNRGVHMDVYEPDKVQWLTDVSKLESVLPPKLYEARFDFNGDLMPYVGTDFVTYNKGLHNHGEEPDRPGYSIQELYYLIRSSFPMQVVTALNTLAAILEKEHLLSLCLETPLLKNLLDSGLYFILRFSLDENQRPVYVAALRAITSLLWNPVDMDFLMETVAVYDNFKLPSFDVVNTDITESDVKEMKDVDLLRVDLVRAVLRTDILKRFRYLLRDPLIEVTDLYRIVKCLTRLACHSYESTARIFYTEDLLEKLFDHLLNNDEAVRDTKYAARLLTLFWLISCRSKRFARSFTAEPLNLVPFLLKSIGDSCIKSFTGVQCIRLWRTLLQYGLIPETVSDLSPVFYQILHSVSVNDISNITVGYASSVIGLVTYLLSSFESSVRHLVDHPLLIEICNRWIAVFLNDVVPCDERLFVIFLSNIVRSLDVATNKKSSSPAVVAMVRKLLAYLRGKSDYSLTECSFVLNATKKDYLTEFPSLRVPISILKLPNYRYLIHRCLKVLINTADNNDDVLLLLEWIWKSYVVKIIDSPLHRVANLWPTKFEISFLYDLIFVTRRRTMPDDLRKLMFRTAFVLAVVIHNDDRHLLIDLFNDILFDKSYFFSNHRSSLPQDDGLEQQQQQLDDLCRYYLKEFRLSNDPQESSSEENRSFMSTPTGTEYALPINWYYIPVLLLSERRRQSADDASDKNDSKDDQLTVAYLKPALKWIYLLEETVPDITNASIPFVARYCFLASAFFYDNLFLDLNGMFAVILKAMLTNVKVDAIDFYEPIPGVTRFQDFYSELCLEFGNVSYGDATFGLFLLVPLQQKYSLTFRKLFWLEHVYVPRFFTTGFDQLPIPFSNYLQPCETDRQLLYAYLEYLLTGTVTKNRSAILYQIALHHVSTFIAEYSHDNKAASTMKKLVENLGNQELKNIILNYKYSGEMS